MADNAQQRTIAMKEAIHNLFVLEKANLDYLISIAADPDTIETSQVIVIGLLTALRGVQTRLLQLINAESERISNENTQSNRMDQEKVGQLKKLEDEETRFLEKLAGLELDAKLRGTSKDD